MPDEKHRSSALDCAIRLLAGRAHGRAELERKLTRKGFDPEAIRSAMVRLDQLNLIDDRAFAGSCMASMVRRRPEGSFKSRARLRQKGLSDEIIEEAIAGINQSELCRAAAEQKLRLLKGPADIVKQKLITFLRNRGFDWSTIKETVNELIVDHG